MSVLSSSIPFSCLPPTTFFSFFQMTSPMTPSSLHVMAQTCSFHLLSSTTFTMSSLTIPLNFCVLSCLRPMTPANITKTLHFPTHPTELRHTATELPLCHGLNYEGFQPCFPALAIVCFLSHPSICCCCFSSSSCCNCILFLQSSTTLAAYFTVSLFPGLCLCHLLDLDAGLSIDTAKIDVHSRRPFSFFDGHLVPSWLRCGYVFQCLNRSNIVTVQRQRTFVDHPESSCTSFAPRLHFSHSAIEKPSAHASPIDTNALTLSLLMNFPWCSQSSHVLLRRQHDCRTASCCRPHSWSIAWC